MEWHQGLNMMMLILIKCRNWQSVELLEFDHIEEAKKTYGFTRYISNTKEQRGLGRRGMG